jgi:transcriptional regulator with XRE-family HTH domain
MEDRQNVDFDQQIAARLRSLRAERNWSLEELARRSQVSRATLSRLEHAEVSPTASVLGRLCAAYGLTMSRLMRMVEDDFEPLIRHQAQWVWRDQDIAFERRSVSPPNAALAGEVIECSLGAGTEIDYPSPTRAGLEHHLLMVEGRLRLTVAGVEHDLQAGDCLRYVLHGATKFEATGDTGARYILFLI